MYNAYWLAVLASILLVGNIALRQSSASVIDDRQLLLVDADPDSGFSWPYYLLIPQTTSPGTCLLVEPNNTGYADDDPFVHREAAQTLVLNRADLADALSCPMLVPTFPRPATFDAYHQSLGRNALTSNDSGLVRTDLQLIAMIRDAQQRLPGLGVTLAEDTRVLMEGFSASANFANRFCLIHPHLVKALGGGAFGGWPTAPISAWGGEELPYPVGMADIQELIAQPFDLDTYLNVPQFFSIGDQNCETCNQIKRLFGQLPIDRWVFVESVHEQVGSNVERHTYSGVGHYLTSEIWSDITVFLQNQASSRTPNEDEIIDYPENVGG